MTYRTMLACLLALFVAVHAAASETVLQFRSLDDPEVVPDAGACAAAPFAANVILGASLWSFGTRAADGEVRAGTRRKLGTGTACFRLTDASFPPASTAPLFSEIDVDGLRLRLDGACTVVTNDVPLVGVVLAGCALRVVDAPAGFVGGVATSNSVFNPFRIPGFSTGSYWTVRLYAE
jgi:hypothetical protein